MEAPICVSAPKAPKMATMPERQPMKLPDQGAEITTDDRRKMIRRAAFAGLSGSPSGLGSPGAGTAPMARPTLG